MSEYYDNADYGHDAGHDVAYEEPAAYDAPHYEAPNFEAYEEKIHDAIDRINEHLDPHAGHEAGYEEPKAEYGEHEAKEYDVAKDYEPKADYQADEYPADEYQGEQPYARS